MKKIYFSYSLKNSPVPSHTSYKLELIDKIEIAIKARFFLNNNEKTKKKESARLLDSNRTPSRSTKRIR